MAKRAAFHGDEVAKAPRGLWVPRICICQLNVSPVNQRNVGQSVEPVSFAHPLLPSTMHAHVPIRSTAATDGAAALSIARMSVHRPGSK